MVPVRGVFTHLNAHVIWDASTRSVIAHHGSDEIRMPLNSNVATVNGRSVSLDSPATIHAGRMVVPLRFISEAMGAGVEWIAETRTVEISTTGTYVQPPVEQGYTLARLNSGTVLPFSLNQKLSSNGSEVGDKFTADLETGESSNYQGMTDGAILEGHVDVARPKTGDTPGVLGLAFDRIRMPDGKTYRVHGTLIGLDSKSVTNDNGRLTAKSGAKNDNLKYVGYGAGAGALVAIVTKGNLITNTLIGGALGFLFGEIQKDPSKSRNVTSDVGTKFGVRLTRDLSYQVAALRADKR